MTRRITSKANIRNLQKKSKYTYYITLPTGEIETLRWRARQKLVVKRRGKKLIIQDWVK